MRNCWLHLRKLFDRGRKIFKKNCVKSVNLELVDRWHAHALCIRYAFASPSKVARLQESRSSAMSRLPRRRARPGAPGTPPLRTKARKKIGDGPVPSTRESGGQLNLDIVSTQSTLTNLRKKPPPVCYSEVGVLP